jgi:hypothetical protein
LEYLTTHLIWLSAFHVIPIAKTATDSPILAALTVLHSIDLSRLSRLAFLMDRAPMGIIPMLIGNANRAILIAKHVNTLRHNAQNANPSISNKDLVVLISVCEVYMETIRHKVVTLTLLLQVCSP